MDVIISIKPIYAEKILNWEKLYELRKLFTKKEINKYVNKVLKVKTKSKFLGFERDIYLKYPKEKNYNYEVKVHTNFKIISKGEIYEKK